MTSARRLEDLLQSADLAIAQTMAPPSKPRSSSPKRDKRYSPPPESSSKRSHSSSVKAHTSIEDVDLLLEAMRATTRKSRRGAGDTTSEVVACPSPRSASPSSSKTGGKLDDLMDALNVWDPEEEDDTWEEYDDYGEGDAGGFASELKSKLPERIEAHEYIGDPIPSGAVAAGKLPATPPPPPEIMIFKDIPDDLSQSPTIPLKKQKKVNLLPLRRANNISIILSRHTRANHTSHAILGAIADLDSSVLTLDDLIAIRGILPTAQEIQLIKGYKGPLTLLAPAETWLRHCIGRGEGLESMVDAFAFSQGVQGDCAEIVQGCSEIVNVSREIMASDGFKGLVRCVYALRGVRDEDYAGFGSGFRAWMGKESRALSVGIDGLVGLCKIGSMGGEWRLLDFLVAMCYATLPSILDTSSPFATQLHSIAGIDLRDWVDNWKSHVKSLTDLESRIYPPDFTEIITPVFSESRLMLDGVDQAFEELERVFGELAVYVGEDLSGYYGMLTSPAAGVEDGEGRRLPMEMYGKMDTFFGEFDEGIRRFRGRFGAS